MATLGHKHNHVLQVKALNQFEYMTHCLLPEQTLIASCIIVMFSREKPRVINSALVELNK